jgi:hypothetical protein
MISLKSEGFELPKIRNILVLEFPTLIYRITFPEVNVSTFQYKNAFFSIYIA